MAQTGATAPSGKRITKVNAFAHPPATNEIGSKITWAEIRQCIFMFNSIPFTFGRLEIHSHNRWMTTLNKYPCKCCDVWSVSHIHSLKNAFACAVTDGPSRAHRSRFKFCQTLHTFRTAHLHSSSISNFNHSNLTSSKMLTKWIKYTFAEIGGRGGGALSINRSLLNMKSYFQRSSDKQNHQKSTRLCSIENLILNPSKRLCSTVLHITHKHFISALNCVITDEK